MDVSMLKTLCKVFELSGTPTAVFYGNDFFENRSFSDFFKDDTASKTEFVRRFRRKGSGGYDIIFGRFIKTNVMHYDDITVVEICDCSTLSDIIESPEMQKYFSCFFSHMRLSVASISDIMDDIGEKLSQCPLHKERMDETVVNVKRCLAEIVSDILDPEQLTFLLNESGFPPVISLSRTIEKAVTEFASCVKDIPIMMKLVGKGLTRSSERSVTVLFADIIRYFCSGILNPDRIYVLVCSENGRVKFSIWMNRACLKDFGGEKKPERSFADDFFLRYMFDLFCAKYGASVENIDNLGFCISFPESTEEEFAMTACDRFETGEKYFPPIISRFHNKPTTTYNRESMKNN